MSPDEAREFLREHHRAVMVTYRSGGGLQSSPVVVGLDADGFAAVSTRQTAYKVHNLRRDPRAVLCVMTKEFFGPWVQIEGTAHLLELPEAMEPLVEHYRTVAGEHPDWDDYRRAMEQEQRVLVRIALERAGPDRSG